MPMLSLIRGTGKQVFSQVFAQSSPTNCTVYAGGCTSGDENALRRAFGQFGRIMEVALGFVGSTFFNSSFKVRYFKDKGYAFVRYDNKESACNAIVALHLTEVEIEKSFMDCVWNFVLPGGGAGC